MKWLTATSAAEVVSTTCDEMVKEGRELAKIHRNIVVKVPLIKKVLKPEDFFRLRNKNKCDALLFRIAGTSCS